MTDQEFAAKRLTQIANQVNEAIGTFWKDNYFDIPYEDASHEALKAIQYLREFSLRPSKRIRAGLAIETYHACGGESQHDALVLGVLTEMSQNYLLIIDDVMDQSAIRRTKPTLQVLYDRGLRTVYPRHQHVADMQAINVGLMASHIANLLMTRFDAKEPDVLRKLVRIYNRCMLHTAYGQINDVLNAAHSVDITEADVIQTYRNKSSYYTFINPMQLGAILADVGQKTMTDIEKIGMPAGIAFQLQDDLIGLFGDEHISGKLPIDDLKEGKMTIPIFRTLQKAGKKEYAQLKDILISNEISKVDYERAKSIIDKYDGNSYTHRMAEDYIGQALQTVNSNTQFKNNRFIKGLLEFIINRNW